MGDMAEYYFEMDLYNDLYREPEEPTWKTKEGKYIPISKMTKKHIKNAKEMLEIKRDNIDYWIDNFNEELECRKKK